MSSQDWCDESVLSIGATNTITNTKGILKAYNTDWIGVKIYFETLDLLTKRMSTAHPFST